jgi:hypothetical protein
MLINSLRKKDGVLADELNADHNLCILPQEQTAPEPTPEEYG